MGSHTAKRTSRKYLFGILGGAGLSLLMGCGYPAFTANPFAANPLAPNPSRTTAQAQTTAEMSLSQLESILREEADEVRGSAGQWQVTLGDRPLVVLADASSNRMRIVTPVITATELSAEQVQTILLANFHTALDARYALSDDTVVSVFVHPLTSLEESHLRSALSQVATLADTFGTTYSSGALDFGPAGQPSAGEGQAI
ncbi:MAG: hypothetical protein WBD47_11610 [Phormidesmis sp.]